ncbi:MAG: hypothetical protein PHD64_11410, partial [Mesotoga sp.]|nr:hypothetical protein [Mesotoga sp.]
MKFLDFVEKHGTSIPKADVEKIELKANKEVIIREMVEGYKLVMGIAEASREIIPLLHDINKILPERNKEKTNELVNKVHAIMPRTNHFFLHVIYAYHYQIQLYLDRYTIREVDNIPDRFECLTAQTDKGINYYGELVEACDLFALQLDKVLKSFGITEHKENKDG